MAAKADVRTQPGTEEIRFGLIDAGTRVGLLKARNSSFTWKWHHDRYCLGIVHAGGYEIAGRGKARGLMPGHVILAEPDDVYACRKALKPVCCDVVFLDTEFVRSCTDHGCRNAEPPHVGTPISDDPTLTAALRRFLTSASDMMPSLATEEALTTTVDVFLAACGHTVRPAGAEPRAVRQVRSILHERLSEVVRLDDLATAVGLNKSYLVRSFTKAVGVPPHAYQRLVRISRARHLLAAGGSAAEIAQQLGFADQSHFIRIFREAVGVTPANYARARLAPRGERMTRPPDSQ
jgi:AraC-like DNA-binding protein